MGLNSIDFSRVMEDFPSQPLEDYESEGRVSAAFDRALQAPFELERWNHDFHVYLDRSDTQSGVSERQAITFKEAKKQKTETSETESQSLERVFFYHKGECKTAELVPTIKECRKKLYSGKVFDLDRDKLENLNPQSPLLKIQAELLVKKAHYDMNEEFQVGYHLSHKNLVKSYFLFHKANQEKSNYKLVTEKTRGNCLRDIKELTVDLTKKHIESTRQCCLYLFDQGYLWASCTEDNIFIETNTDELKFTDYQDWEKSESQPIDLAHHLIVEAAYIMVSLISKTRFCKIKESIIDRNRIYQIIPKKEHQEPSREEVKAWLASAFDVILKNLDRAVAEPDAFTDEESSSSCEFD